MNVLLILAVVAFGSGAVVSAIQKSWALALVSAGLFSLALSSSGWIAT